MYLLKTDKLWNEQEKQRDLKRSIGKLFVIEIG